MERRRSDQQLAAEGIRHGLLIVPHSPLRQATQLTDTHSVRVLSIVHQRDAGSGVFGEAAQAAGHELLEWVPAEQPSAPDAADAALVFGGAMNVGEEEGNPWLAGEKRLLRELLRDGTPLLGVCLGAQLVADAAGAEVRRAALPEIGWHEVELLSEAARDPVLGSLAEPMLAFQWHSYEFTLPPGGVALARSPVCLQAFRVGPKAWGIQFHAEVTGAAVGAWLDGYRNDPDAVRIGIDPEALRAETEQRIEAWNEVGRELCGRFLEAAATPA
jgi:GMP synthase (glutamine-hydrolysing)